MDNQQRLMAKEEVEFKHYDNFYEELVDDPEKPWSGEFCRRIIKAELEIACPGLEDEVRGKTVLDLGGGCTGVLRLLKTAAVKIELDPLIDRYMKAGKLSISGTSDTILLKGYGERIPISDAFVDVIISRNALDHVDDLNETACEISRVLKPGGLFVLVVDIKKEPTLAEPSNIGDPAKIKELFCDFVIEHWEVREIPNYEKFLKRRSLVRPTYYGRLRKKATDILY